MAVDIDAYIAKNTPDFNSGVDIDAYIAKNTNPKDKTKGSALQAGVESFGNTVLLGNLPQVQAAVSKLLPDPSAELDERLKSEGFKITQPEQRYVDIRDANIRRQQQQAQDFPGATTAGTIAGLAVPIPLLKGAQGLTKAERLLQAGKSGAILGALQNPGDVEGEVSPVQFSERLSQSGQGALFGLGSQFGLEKGGELLGKASQGLKNRAALKAVKALGGTNKQKERLQQKGQELALGETLLDEDIVPFFGSPKRILARLEAAKEKSGKRIGQIIDQADEKVDFTPIDFVQPKTQFTPISIKQPAKELIESQSEILYTPIRIDKNKLNRAFPWLKGKDLPPKVVRGETQPLQRRLLEKARAEVIPGKVQTTEIPGAKPFISIGKDIKVPINNNTIDMKELASKLRKDPDIASLGKIPGAEAVGEQAEKILDTLASNKVLNLRESQNLRAGIDKQINFAAASLDKGKQSILNKVRNKIAMAMDIASGGELRPENIVYSNLSRGEEMLLNRVGREAANRGVSLTDYITGGAAGNVAAKITGDPTVTALVTGLSALTNKGSRKFGAAMSANINRSLSKLGAKGQKILQFFEQNPTAFQYLFAAQKGAPELDDNQKFAVLNDPSVIQILSENPSLIDNIADEKLRNEAMKRVKSGDSAIERRLRGGF